jgi:DNA gyrase subunit A
LVHYIDFQKEVIRRRTQFDLDKALARAHILEGLRIALDHIDEVIALIRSSRTTEQARTGLMEKFGLSEKQAQAILDMRLQRLTGLERDKIEDEYNALMKDIAYYREILANESLVLKIIKDELLEIKSKYSDERRTAIERNPNDIDIEDLIQEQNVVITLTHAGYIKRIPADTYTAQKRGGRGIQAMATKEDDFVEHIFITSTHNHLLFFTNLGRVYRLKGYELPEAGRSAKGTNLVNILPLNPGEKIQAVMPIKEFEADRFLVMATKEGLIKKTDLSDFSAIRKNGLTAINLREGDELIGVKMTDGQSEILIVTENGYSMRFNETDVRPMGRTATGVKAITLREGDRAVSMNVVAENEDVLIVSENGFGKRTGIDEYPAHRRGGKGIITYKVTEKTGKIVGARIVKDGDEIMLINTSGVAIRLNAANISVTGRNTMGVTLMKTTDEEKVVAIAKINKDDAVEEATEEENQ